MSAAPIVQVASPITILIDGEAREFSSLHALAVQFAELSRLRSAPVAVAEKDERPNQAQRAAIMAGVLGKEWRDCGNRIHHALVEAAWKAGHESACSAPVAVEVLERPFPVLDLHGEPMRGISLTMYCRGWDDLASKLRPIPSDRVLKEGELAVPVAYLEALQSAANRFCSSCRDNNSTCTMTARHFGGTGCGAWKLDGARINALRSHRAAEGGAA